MYRLKGTGGNQKIGEGVGRGGYENNFFKITKIYFFYATTVRCVVFVGENLQWAGMTMTRQSTNFLPRREPSQPSPSIQSLLASTKLLDKQAGFTLSNPPSPSNSCSSTLFFQQHLHHVSSHSMSDTSHHLYLSNTLPFSST